MMTVLSLLVCLGLLVKLLFFTDDRLQSRLFYRAILFLAAIYTFYQILLVAYGLEQPSPWRVLLHLTLFIGAFFIKAHHLPWNQK